MRKIIFKIFVNIVINEIHVYFIGTFKTDSVISRNNNTNGQVPERELEPWVGPGCNGDDGCELESTSAVSCFRILISKIHLIPYLYQALAICNSKHMRKDYVSFLIKMLSLFIVYVYSRQEFNVT